eukprot:278691_1
MSHIPNQQRLDSKIMKCPHNKKSRHQTYYPSDPFLISIADIHSTWTLRFKNRKYCEFNCNKSDSISLVTVIRNGLFIDYTMKWCSICESDKICCGAVTVDNPTTLKMTMKMAYDI